MKQRIKKIFATSLCVLFIVGLVSFLSYKLIVEPILYGYGKYGWEGVGTAIIGEILIYGSVYLIAILFCWAIDTASE